MQSLRASNAVVGSQLEMPVNISHDEIIEKSQEGFSKKFVKIARQAVLVALRKETNIDTAAQSVISYLRETR